MYITLDSGWFCLIRLLIEREYLICMKHQILVLLVICIVTLLSCRRPSAPDGYSEIIYPDEYVEGQDFNYTAYGISPNTLAVSDEGIYFKSGTFLWYADFRTLKAKPLCYKLTCRHLYEMPEKVPECNAFSYVWWEKDFLGIFRDHIYFTVRDCTTGLDALVKTNLDGSERETVIPDVHHIMANHMRIHRGVLYYPEQMIDLDGNVRYTYMAIDLTKTRMEPELLFDGSTVPGSFTEILPYGNYIYYNEKIVVGEPGSKRQKARYSRYNILNKTNEVLMELTECELCGIVDHKLIFYDGSVFYELDPETKEIRTSELGIQKYAESHPGWVCSVWNISKEITFISVEDGIYDETSAHWNRIIVDNDGEEIVRKYQPNSKLHTVTDQIIRMNGEEYYLWYNADIHNYSVSLCKMEDLLAGELKPKYMLGPIDLNELSVPYSYTIKNDE